MLKTCLLGCLTYGAIAAFAFRSVLKPLLLATVWSNRLGAPHWYWIVLACFAAGASSFLLPSRFSLIRGPAFVAIGLLGSLLSVGAYAGHLRDKALDLFGADQRIQHSFLQSVRHAPTEAQFFLHAAAMKDCVPYAWSYRKMNVYRLPLAAAVNVLPAHWLAECHILRK